MPSRLLAVASAIALAAVAFAPAVGGETSTVLAANSQQDGVMTSFDGTKIHYTIFRPAGASAEAPVPMVFSSHGWGGSRTKNMTSWMDAGFGGISFDQRGFGQSGDLANVEDPEIEGKDIAGLLDIVQGLDWVMRDVDAEPTEDGGSPWGLDDPTVFATGGSYGGGYQTVGALTEIADNGDTRFDALAPEITWYDLPESLGPQQVARSAWLTALTAPSVMDVPDYILRGYIYGATTGQWPDGTAPDAVAPNLNEVFGSHGPSGFVEGGSYVPEGGIRLNIPALWRQGSSDTLFNLNQGIQNLENMDDSVRDGSYLIGYNGGHVLPTALPRGSASGSDPCSAETASKNYTQLTRDFFNLVAAGESTEGFLSHSYGIADMDGTCIWTDDVRTTQTFDIGHDISVTSGTITTTGAGAPQFFDLFPDTVFKCIAEPPAECTGIPMAGVPTVTATYYSASVDQRVFFGLAKGTSEADAVIMQHQMMPHRELLPSIGHDIEIELGAGALHMKPGEKIYLVVSPVVELFFGHGSARTPGVVALEDIQVHIPWQGVDMTKWSE